MRFRFSYRGLINTARVSPPLRGKLRFKLVSVMYERGVGRINT